ncbi:MAG: hypothetical protein IMX04_02985 [Candidatus Carbobacillus altaicus]|nr:hypothetical protein [Candidatus Carbobacillus altaicus]
MGRRMTFPPLWLDLRTMGWNFSFPLVAHLGIVLYLYLGQGGQVGMLTEKTILGTIGLWSPLLITFWIVGLYQDWFESDGKEALLALPYKSWAFGIGRVLRTTALYGFFVWGITRLLFLFSSDRGVSQMWWTILAASILFFAALAFFTVALTRRLVFTYMLVAVFSLGEWVRVYSTSLRVSYSVPSDRTVAFNPFQAASPLPGANPLRVALILFIVSLLLLFLGQLFVNRREYLLK